MKDQNKSISNLNNIDFSFNQPILEESKQLIEFNNDNSEESEQDREIKDDPNNEIIEYLLPTMEHKIIDSLLSSKNFFINHLTKKIPDSENLTQIRQKLAINDEYKDAIANENLRSNKYSDKLSFRNNKIEKITKEQIDIAKTPLMLSSEKFLLQEKNLLNKKTPRELNSAEENFKIPNLVNKNILNNENISKKTSENIMKKSTENNSLATIPEKFRKNLKDNNISATIPEINLDTENSDNSNLFLSLYRNKNHICFRKNKLVTPEWHAPWKLYRVISGHNGWVRCIDVDPTNNWFVTGSNDRVIKFWDLASGKLKLSLTGHINTVRSVVISNRHPYLFSCGEDKQVKCWDLEQNKVVRNYHGHLSGVHSLSLHPNMDVIITGGRDCVARVWDIRSKQQIMCLEGHNNTISTVVTQEFNPQVITGSYDSTIKLWDLGSGKCMNTLTHHKKSIRSLIVHETDYSFVSGIFYDLISYYF